MMQTPTFVLPFHFKIRLNSSEGQFLYCQRKKGEGFFLDVILNFNPWNFCLSVRSFVWKRRKNFFLLCSFGSAEDGFYWNFKRQLESLGNAVPGLVWAWAVIWKVTPRYCCTPRGWWRCGGFAVPWKGTALKLMEGFSPLRSSFGISGNLPPTSSTPPHPWNQLLVVGVGFAEGRWLCPVPG